MVEIKEIKQGAVIKVIGVGGAGGNAVRNMINADVQNIDFIVANTDAQALRDNPAPVKIQLGATMTEGLGAGGHPEVGKKAAIDTQEDIEAALQGANLVFVTAGMGGGTGTGAAPVIAQIAKDMGALTVAVVSTPFFHEGKYRHKYAADGLIEMKNHVDTYIVVNNDKILDLSSPNTTFIEAFALADNVLRQGVQGISDAIKSSGYINVDFADIRSIMKDAGMALMGIGEAEGENRDVQAAEMALQSPLLNDASIKGSQGILINITGGPDIKMFEIQTIASKLYECVGDDAAIYQGVVINEDMTGKVRVTVVATGFGKKREKKTIAVEDYLHKTTPKAADITANAEKVRERDSNLRKINEVNIEESAVPAYFRKQQD